MVRTWFYDITGEERNIDLDTKTIFMPYNIDPENYSQRVRDFISAGFVVQLEIV